MLYKVAKVLKQIRKSGKNMQH